MSDNIKISVIMPVHNRGRLVREAIEDIVAQDFSDYELICVDDASDEEEALTVLYEYSSRHKFVRIIKSDKPNGAGVARNIGLKNAGGEYVIFLDSDDRFDSDLLKLSYKSVIDMDADISLLGYRKWDVQTGQIIDRSVNKELIENRCNNEFFLTDIVAAPWNKLCRKRFLLENGIEFQDIRSCNDYAFSVVSLSMADRITLAGEGRALFSYRLGLEDQISKQRDCRNLFDAYVYAKKFLASHMHVDSFLSLQQLAKLMLSGVYQIKREGTVYREEFYKEIRQELIRENPIFKTESLNVIRDYYIDSQDSFEWMDLAGDFLMQLKNKEDLLIEAIQDGNRWVVWGNGKRSLALQKLLKGKGFDISICETGDRNVGKYTDIGNLIISTEDALNSFEKVIASTEKVYRYLKEKEVFHNHIILNLSVYCPLE